MTEPEWLDADQLRDWMSLVGLLMTLPVALDSQLKRDTGLNSFEYHILAALSDSPVDALPMTDLAELSRGSASRLSHAVSRLEQAGWVERRACVEAGRRTAAHLTAAGRARLEEAAPTHVREVRRLVIDAISPEQLHVLGEAARTIIGTIDPSMRERIGSPDCRPENHPPT